MPQFPESAERAEIISVLQALHATKRVLLDALLTHASAWWAWPDDGRSTRKAGVRYLVEGIGSLHYEKGQSPVDSKIYPGVICVPEDVCRLADEVNRLKAQLHRCALAMGDRMKNDWNERRQAYDQVTFFRYALRNAGEGHLNFWHSSRKLNVLLTPPRMISFVWYRPYEIKTFAVAEVRARLQSSTLSGRVTAELIDDLKALKSLSDDQLLARRIERPAHPRANLVTETVKGTERSVVRAALPLIVSSNFLPKIRPLPASPPSAKRDRARVALNEVIIIKHLGLHLYEPQNRRRGKAGGRVSA